MNLRRRGLATGIGFFCAAVVFGSGWGAAQLVAPSKLTPASGKHQKADAMPYFDDDHGRFIVTLKGVPATHTVDAAYHFDNSATPVLIGKWLPVAQSRHGTRVTVVFKSKDFRAPATNGKSSQFDGTGTIIVTTTDGSTTTTTDPPIPVEPTDLNPCQ